MRREVSGARLVPAWCAIATQRGTRALRAGSGAGQRGGAVAPQAAISRGGIAGCRSGRASSDERSAPETICPASALVSTSCMRGEETARRRVAEQL